MVFFIYDYNNVYGRWITTHCLGQMKDNSKLNNGWFNKWLEILVGEHLQTKLRKSENVDFKFSARNGRYFSLEFLFSSSACHKVIAFYKIATLTTQL